MIYQFTGHPFVDAGVAGIAAILEQNGDTFATPEDISPANVESAIEATLNLYCQKIAKDDKKPNEQMPLFYFLLQEVLPGSSWDQAKTGKDIPASKIAKLTEYIEELRRAAKSAPIGSCFLTGSDAHLMIDKSKLPLLASGEERPNCYPNLSDGYPVSAWIAIAVLFSPLSIEKSVNEEGKGSSCLIYHSPDWRFMVEIARRNLLRINTLLAASSIESYRLNYYKGVNGKRKYRGGTWKMAMSTLLHIVSRLDEQLRPQVSIWSFNASNTSCRYDCVQVSSSFLTIHDNRHIHENAYRDIPRCSDAVCRLILEGRPIVKHSIIEDEKQKKAERFARTRLMPRWGFQRLYAEKVLQMPARLLNAVEQSALFLAQDAQAVSYCLFPNNGRIRLAELTDRYKIPGEFAVVFADYPSFWRDLLRAAVLWAAKGNQFPANSTDVGSPGAAEALILDVSVRLRLKHGYKRLAAMLSAPFPHHYRNTWLRLLSDGACTWDDFLAFNPIEEALSISGYHRTRILREYLIAYLLGCTNKPKTEMSEEDQQETDESLIPDVLLSFSDDEDEEE